MAARFSYLIKTYLWTVVVFIIAKLVFVTLGSGTFVSFCASDMCDVIRHGLSLDLSTALYFLILPLLLTMVSIFWQTKWLQWILKGYYRVISLAFALAFVADTSLYPFWGYKLDASCLQYLNTPGDMMASVSTGYLLTRLAALLLASSIIYKGYPKNFNSERVSGLKKYIELILYILLMPLMVIGIRGGLDESTTNVGQVYYSQNQFLNHSAVNPVFNFISSLEKTVSEVVDYEFLDEQKCKQLLDGRYPTESIGTDTLLRTDRPNVVIILMESCGNVFTKVMPNLNRLKGEGIWFSNCYANSYRTDRGTVSTLSGYPSFPTMSVMKMPRKSAWMPSIARTLQKENYQTSYLYGGDINFTHMRSYLIATGWEKLHWKADYTTEEQNSAKWGVRDDITFKTLYNQICTADTTGVPFLMGYSTLSSHEPWDVPVKKYNDEIMNAFYYLDQCLGQFISDLKATSSWNDLLIVILPDHGFSYQNLDETCQERNHIPMLWIGGAIKAPREIQQICNQTDLAATLLAQMRLPHQDFTFSRDVMSNNYAHPFAIHCFNNGFSIADSTGFTVYDLTAEQVIANNGNNSEQHVELGKAILQTTSKDLQKDK